MTTIAEMFARLEFKIDRLSEKKVDKKLKSWRKKMGGIGKGVSGAFSRTGKVAIAAGIAGVGIAFVAGARDALKFDKALTRFDIDAQGAAGTMNAFRGTVLKLSRDTGVAKEELLAGAAAFVEGTGKGELATAAMKVLGKATIATGASTSDLSAAMVSLSQNLAVEPQQFERALAILAKSGKEGAVELRNMASVLPSLAALFENFGERGLEGTAQLGAALQITKKGFGTAGEAATGLESLMGQIIGRATQLEKAGVKVFRRDKKGGITKNFQSLVKIVPELNKLLGKNRKKFQEAFGRRKEALLALGQLAKVRGEWEGLTAEVGKATSLTADYDKAQASAAAKATRAWNGVKVALTEAFTPERVASLAKALTAVLRLASALIERFALTAEFIERFVIVRETTRKASPQEQQKLDKTLKKLGVGGKQRAVDRAKAGPALQKRIERRAAAGNVRAQETLRAFKQNPELRKQAVERLITANTNITVNAVSSDPQAVATEVEKAVRRGLRNTAAAGAGA